MAIYDKAISGSRGGISDIELRRYLVMSILLFEYSMYLYPRSWTYQIPLPSVQCVKWRA